MHGPDPLNTKNQNRHQQSDDIGSEIKSDVQPLLGARYHEI